MEQTTTLNPRAAWLAYLLLGAGVICGLADVLGHSALVHTDLLYENLPKFTGGYLLQLLLSALCALLLVGGIAVLSQNVSNPDKVWDRWGAIFWVSDQGAEREWSRTAVKKLAVWLLILLALCCLLLFLASPMIFGYIALEDYPVEQASALFWFIAMAIFALSAWALGRQKRGGLATLLWGLTLICLLIGGEEVSWFQRDFNFQTPSSFAANSQDELNFHNFATNTFENLYYGAGFLFLILLPFVVEKTGLLRSSFLAPLLPGRFILYISVILAAYNYDMWNIPFTQLAAFISFGILLYLLIFDRQGQGRLLGVLITAFVLSQALFLLLGYRFYRSSDVTEYKEFFIPLGFLCYAIEVWVRIRRLPRQIKG